MPLLAVHNPQISWTPLLVLGYLFYLLLGAMVFQLLEKQAETHFRDQFQLEKLKFLQNYTCLDRQALEQFVQATANVHQQFKSYSVLTPATTVKGGVGGKELGAITAVLHEPVCLGMILLGTRMPFLFAVVFKSNHHAKKSGLVRLSEVFSITLVFHVGFHDVLMEAWEKGVNPEGNSTNPSNWDFSNSFFFAGTVVTTIGYGNLSPSTVAGQIFCVFYALFGVPLNLAFLNQLGKGLNAHLITLERWVQKPGRAQVVQTLAVAIFLTTGTLFFLVFPPLVFSYVEGWSYGEGFYFTFITLSTIGFGDYVVGTNPNKHYIPVYRSLTAIWIVFGLAWLALVFNVGADLMEKFLQLKWHKPDLSLAEGATIKLEDEPEQPRIHIPS